MLNQRSISGIECITIILLVIFGSWSISFIADTAEIGFLKETPYLRVWLDFALSALAIWSFLSLSKIEKPVRLPAALWTAASWNIIHLSQVPFWGFLLLPIELFFGGLALSFRSELTTWKAISLVIIVRFLVLLILNSHYLLDLLV